MQLKDWFVNITVFLLWTKESNMSAWDKAMMINTQQVIHALTGMALNSSV